jgi:uncharacterized membrane protein YidH (DUF202 family)
MCRNPSHERRKVNARGAPGQTGRRVIVPRPLLVGWNTGVMQRRWWQHREPALYTVGTEPDPRFSYANERTFLAWNRMSLALVAAGLAITSLLPEFDVGGGRRLIGVPLIVLGAVLSVASYRRWEANERAMRLG